MFRNNVFEKVFLAGTKILCGFSQKKVVHLQLYQLHLNSFFISCAMQQNKHHNEKKKRAAADSVSENGIQKKQSEQQQVKQTPIQKKNNREEEIQRKKAENALQMKHDNNGDTENFQQSLTNKEGALTKMESAFGQDFSDVSIFPDSQKATQMKAQAYTQGNNIHFAPGKFQPESKSGQELLGHELTHVVQQRQGRVQPLVQTKSFALNNSPHLEKEADDFGKLAAGGKRVPLQNKPTATTANAPVQRKEAMANTSVFLRDYYEPLSVMGGTGQYYLKNTLVSGGRILQGTTVEVDEPFTFSRSQKYVKVSLGDKKGFIPVSALTLSIEAGEGLPLDEEDETDENIQQIEEESGFVEEDLGLNEKHTSEKIYTGSKTKTSETENSQSKGVSKEAERLKHYSKHHIEQTAEVMARAGLFGESNQKKALERHLLGGMLGAGSSSEVNKMYALGAQAASSSSLIMPQKNFVGILRGIQATAEVAAQAGFEGSIEGVGEAHIGPLAGEIKGALSTFVGGAAGASGSISAGLLSGIKMSGAIEAFVGAKLAASGGVGTMLKVYGKEIIGLGLESQFEAVAGAGAEAEGELQLGLNNVLSGSASAWAGAKASGSVEGFLSILGWQFGLELNGEAFAGAEVTAEGKLGLGLFDYGQGSKQEEDEDGISQLKTTDDFELSAPMAVIEGKASAFAGAKVSAQLLQKLRYKGRPVFKMGGGVEASAGVGAEVGGSIGVDAGVFKTSVLASGALGVGLGGEFMVELDMKALLAGIYGTALDINDMHNERMRRLRRQKKLEAIKEKRSQATSQTEYDTLFTEGAPIKDRKGNVDKEKETEIKYKFYNFLYNDFCAYVQEKVDAGNRRFRKDTKPIETSVIQDIIDKKMIMEPLFINLSKYKAADEGIELAIKDAFHGKIDESRVQVRNATLNQLGNIAKARTDWAETDSTALENLRTGGSEQTMADEDEGTRIRSLFYHALSMPFKKYSEKKEATFMKKQLASRGVKKTRVTQIVNETIQDDPILLKYVNYKEAAEGVQIAAQEAFIRYKKQKMEKITFKTGCVVDEFTQLDRAQWKSAEERATEKRRTERAALDQTTLTTGKEVDMGANEEENETLTARLKERFYNAILPDMKEYASNVTGVFKSGEVKKVDIQKILDDKIVESPFLSAMVEYKAADDAIRQALTDVFAFKIKDISVKRGFVTLTEVKKRDWDKPTTNNQSTSDTKKAAYIKSRFHDAMLPLFRQFSKSKEPNKDIKPKHLEKLIRKAVNDNIVLENYIHYKHADEGIKDAIITGLKGKINTVQVKNGGKIESLDIKPKNEWPTASNLEKDRKKAYESGNITGSEDIQLDHTQLGVTEPEAREREKTESRQITEIFYDTMVPVVSDYITGVQSKKKGKPEASKLQSLIDQAIVKSQVLFDTFKYTAADRGIALAIMDTMGHTLRDKVQVTGAKIRSFDVESDRKKWDNSNSLSGLTAASGTTTEEKAYDHKRIKTIVYNAMINKLIEYRDKKEIRGKHGVKQERIEEIINGEVVKKQPQIRNLLKYSAAREGIEMAVADAFKGTYTGTIDVYFIRGLVKINLTRVKFKEASEDWALSFEQM